MEDNTIIIEDSTEPVSKKARLAESLDQFISKIENSEEPLRAVLPDEYYNPIPFTKVYVGQVKDVKELSKIISILNQKISLKDLSHLKRACRKEVILFSATHLNSQTHASIQYYLEEHVNELRDSFEYFKIIDVPAIAPKLRKQYVECGRSWSCNFHPDKYLESLYNATLFNLLETKSHRLYMGMAFEVAKFFMSKENPNLEPSDILLSDVNATVVVDANYHLVVAVAFDNRHNSPVQHSAMLAIDNVAKTQNGGVWFDGKDNHKDRLRGINNTELFLYLKQKYPESQFGARPYLAKSEMGDGGNVSGSPYLCTYYNVYMIREPCLMCSMALLHARCNRVFFYNKNDKGGVCSKTKLHCVPSLNHHFEVFTDF